MTIGGGSGVSMSTSYTGRARWRLGEKSGAWGALAGDGSVADRVSRGQEPAGGHATKSAELRIHVCLVIVLGVERHVRQPHWPRDLELAENAMEAHDAAVQLRRETDLVAERLDHPRFRESRPLAQRRDRDGATAHVELRDGPGDGPVHAPRPRDASADPLGEDAKATFDRGRLLAALQELADLGPDEVGEVQREARRLPQRPPDDSIGAGRTQPNPDDALVCGLLEHDGRHLRTAKPGGPA